MIKAGDIVNEKPVRPAREGGTVKDVYEGADAFYAVVAWPPNGYERVYRVGDLVEAPTEPDSD